ncbi:MAG: hypothetical protein KY432_11090 [Acidobacteria bacterium]|nr:hypothetical protein [Acidobacteriota bacterium]
MTTRPTTFLFDIGNTLIQLDYEKALAGICKYAEIDRDKLVQIMEWSGGYHDLERGAINFDQFHDFMRSRAGYHGGVDRLRTSWCEILAAPVEGIEELLDRIRQQYRVAFLSNCNEVHAELIQRRYGILLGDDETAERFGGVVALPTTLIVDREGQIVSSHTGLVSKSEYVDDIEKLL